MPQGDALFPGLSVRDNLDSGAFAAGWRERRKRRDRVLQLFPASLTGSARAGTLSGGERRMCSLGRGLMADARVYLIDEPSLGLAPGIAAGLFSTLRELDLEGGALVLAEQNQTLLEGWIDRIVGSTGGRSSASSRAARPGTASRPTARGTGGPRMTDLVTTVNLAAIYGLIAVGISLTWAGLGFLNLAHGVTFAAAGYGAWWAQENISDHPSVIFLGGIVVGALAGAIICLSVFLPLDGKPNWDFRSMIASLGLAIIGVNTYLIVFGPQRKAIDLLFGTTKFKIGGTTITADKSGAIISATVVMILVVIGLVRTRIGLGVRALTQNPEGAALVGIGRKQAAFAILIVSGASPASRPSCSPRSSTRSRTSATCRS